MRVKPRIEKLARDRPGPLILMKVADAYQLTGHPENLAFFVHGRGHAEPYETRELIYKILDAHLEPLEAARAKLVGP